MGAPKQKWTEDEERALRAGVMKHGVGKWRAIQKDPSFKAALASRTNVDLKDKWRNLTFDPQLSPGKKMPGDKRGRSKTSDTGSGRGKKIACHGNGLFVDSHTGRRPSSGSASSTPSPRSSKSGSLTALEPALDDKLAEELALAGGVDAILSRLEDCVVAAIIALSGGSGSPADEILSWVQVACRNGRNAAPKDLQAVLSKLVAQRRITHVEGCYVLAGYVKKYDQEENLDLFPHKDSPRRLDGSLQKVTVAIAALAAKAVSDAEEAALHATRLTKEAEMLKARQQAAVKEAQPVGARQEPLLPSVPLARGIDLSMASGGTAGSQAPGGNKFMMFGAAPGMGQLIASV